MLRAIEQTKVDQVLCLGDLVGFHAEPDECVSLVRQRSIRCVRGNHDAVAAGLKEPTYFSQVARRAIEWTRQRISETTRRYLASLPTHLVIDERLLMVHAALHPRPNEDVRLNGDAEVQQSLQAMRRDFAGVGICFFGHTHRAAAYLCRGTMVWRVSGEMVKLDGEASYLVNPGAVGQSRDGDARAAFAVYDTNAGTLRFCRVNYDRRSCQAKAQAAGLMPRLGLVGRSADRLRRGLEAGRSLIREKTGLF